MKKLNVAFVMVCILAACAAPTQIIPSLTSAPVPTNTLALSESSTTLPSTLEPDGKPLYQMAFITYTQEIYRLWVVNSDGSGLKLLHPPLDWGFQLEPTLPEWSPDGKSLYFVAESLMKMSPDEQFQESSRPEDFYISKDEAWQRRYILDIALSPDGTYLAVICLPENSDDPITVDGRPEVPVLVLLNVKTSTSARFEIHNIIAGNNSLRFADHPWSPDGTKILLQSLSNDSVGKDSSSGAIYMATNSRGGGAYILSTLIAGLNGEVISLIESDGASMEGVDTILLPIWSPDGKYIYGVKIESISGPNYPEQYVLSQASSSDGESVQGNGIGMGSNSTTPLAISQDGKVAAVSNTDVLIVSNKDDSGEVSFGYLYENQMGIYAPVWSPDGRWLAFVCGMEVCSLNYSQYVQQVTRSNDLTINDFLYHLGSTNSVPTWSPDGRLVFYSFDENGSEGLFIANADGSDKRKPLGEEEIGGYFQMPFPPIFPPSPIVAQTPSLTPMPGIGSIMIGNDGATLVYVPAGEFTMGEGTGVHSVKLDAFWIDQTEVTNKQYAACVSDRICPPPLKTSSYTHPSYYGNPIFDEFPVIYVGWDQANIYCSWAGRELPSEAQWEKAARGTDARSYPWGEDEPNYKLLNFNNVIGDTIRVGNYPDGASPYGAYDMAGNVWEWVNDWHSDTYYQSSPSSNPLGPASGQERVLRGGTWGSRYYIVRSTVRFSLPPTQRDNYVVGFRCASSLADPPISSTISPSHTPTLAPFVLMKYPTNESCKLRIDSQKWEITDPWKNSIISTSMIMPVSYKSGMGEAFFIKHRNYPGCNVAWATVGGFEGVDIQTSTEEINNKNWEIWSIENDLIRMYFWTDLRDIHFMHKPPLDDSQKESCQLDVYEVIESLTCE